MYPTTIVFRDALRGGDYFQDVGILSDFGIARTYRFEAEGTTAKWVSFADPSARTSVERITAPPHSQANVLVHLTLPQDVANGKYSGVIRAVTTDAGGVTGGNSGSAVNIGGEIPIEVTVTGTQNLSGKLTDIVTKDAEIGTPLKITASVTNSGNVNIRPDINVKIVDTTAVVVGEAGSSDHTIPPNETKQLMVEWDTARQKPGDYKAILVARADKLDLGTREITFRLVPFGALNRSGQLEKIELAAMPRPGELAKFRATFQNTGQIDSKSVFVGELYRDNHLLQQLSSQERFVLVAETVQIDAFATIPGDGTYALRGKVNYEGKETEVKELTFSVGSEDGLSASLMLGLGGGTAAVVVGLGLLVVRRRRGAGSREPAA